MIKFSYYLKQFFDEYLEHQLGASFHTVKSYKNTFKIFLEFMVNEKNIPISKIDFNIITKELVREFLNYLENTKNNSAITRNNRLAAIKSFYQFVGIEEPSYLYEFQGILSIKSKKSAKKEMDYLTQEELKKIFENIDISNKKGRRNLVLLTLLYDSAIRVSELVNIRVMDLRLNDEPSVTILGKGNKYRKIPIMNKTKEMLLNYINENHLELSSYLFTNYGKNKLSIRMVQLIINKYNITNKKISPHSFRRSRAVHMLEADINIVYIRDILGHVSVTTTERYAMVSLELKKRALEKTNNNTISLEKQTSWNTDPDLLNELLSL